MFADTGEHVLLNLAVKENFLIAPIIPGDIALTVSW
jgi:hypothetical protein